MRLKTGKAPPKYDPRTLTFATYALSPTPTTEKTALPLPQRSKSAGHYSLIPKTGWDMLGNDQYGDCVFAGAAHEHMLWDAAASPEKGSASKQVFTRFSPDDVLAAYSQVTGFSPQDPQNTDNGTVVLDALNYRRQAGIFDTTGKRRCIAAYVALEPGNFEQLLEAIFLFGLVGIGINFPTSAMDQFNHPSQPQPWSVVPGSPIEDGHYIPVVGYTSRFLYCVTWGRLQKMTRAFYAKYCDEAYAYLSSDQLNPTSETTPEGFDFEALQQDLENL